MELQGFPTTALELERRFGDERACRESLAQVRWPNGFRCPRCDGPSSYFVIERGLEQCMRVITKHP